MVHIPIENKLSVTENSLEDLLLDFSHMIYEVGEENEKNMKEIHAKTYEVYELLSAIRNKITQ